MRGRTGKETVDGRKGDVCGDKVEKKDVMRKEREVNWEKRGQNRNNFMINTYMKEEQELIASSFQLLSMYDAATLNFPIKFMTTIAFC